MIKPPIYLDYNASAPLLPVAREAILAALEIDANPSSVHASGRAAKAIIAKARRQVAGLVGAKADHVVFTSGATEAAQMLLTPFYSMGRSPLKMSHLYVCAADHPCLLAGGQFGASDVTQFGVLPSGEVDLEALDEILKQHDKSKGLPLVAIHYANNETGVIQPVEEISKSVKAAGGILVLDAVQAVGRVEIDLSRGFADYLIVSSHKLGGPKGAGAVVSASDLVMPMPLIKGGGQERGHRGGTEATANIAGFGAAAEFASSHIQEFGKLRELQDSLIDGLKLLDTDMVIHGHAAERLPNTVFFTLPGAKAETLHINFDLAGFAVSSGSACSSGKVGRSHVLDAMGVNSNDGAVRVSFGLATSESDLKSFLAAFSTIMTRLKR